MTGVFEVSKEMGITHAEFRRLVATALGGEPSEKGATFTYAPASGKTLAVTLGPQRVRKIALLEMPVTTVTLRFDGFSDTERKTALIRFERAFQRGGG